MTQAEKLQRIAENEQKVFDAGKHKEWSDFWDAFQQNGKRTDYQGGFYGSGWNDSNFKPKYDITNPINTASMFVSVKITDLDALLQNAGVKFSTASTIRMDAMFYYSSVTVVPEIDTRNVTNSASLQQLFSSASALHTVRKLIVSENCKFINAFSKAISLQNITFEGTIANDINFQDCPLSSESVWNIIDHLYNPNDHDEPLFLPYERTIILSDTAWANADAIAESIMGEDFFDIYGNTRGYVGDVFGWSV